MKSIKDPIPNQSIQSTPKELRLPFHFAKLHGLFISSVTEDHATITHLANPAPEILIECRRFLNRPIQFNQVETEAFSLLLAKAYESDSSAAKEIMLGMEEGMDLDQLVHALPKPEDLLESEDDAPIIKLLNAVFTQAIKQTASDIHVETFENRLSIRFRVDGVLREILEPPRVLGPLIISRLKVMAKLDIAEKRLPQDGRITLHIAGRLVDVRISTLPSSHGERVVLRLLDKQTAPLNLLNLGMSKSILETVNQLIYKPHGIFLVTGPTGSGKTTTLYAALSELNDQSRNILTVEDPIEYDLPGIGQTQVNPKVDMTFARGLRAILRQDPDIVMIGEIRDLETAQIAVQASLTGHLVFSTLHTNSAIGAITRLRDMGIEPYLLSSTIIGVASQRLVRVLCRKCKQAVTLSKSEQSLLAAWRTNNKLNTYQAKGCDHCSGTGYRGRTGIYEIIPIDPELSQMIHDQVNEQELESHAQKTASTMREDGFRLVALGTTTLKEVMQVTTEL